jgi:O-antigen ligase
MFTRNHQGHFSHLTLAIGLAISLLGLTVGILAGVQPLYLSLGMGAVVFIICFFKNFELTVLGLLVLRSALDPFSEQQLPAAFALGVDGLTVLYISVKVWMRQQVYTDAFWWFFAGWVALQGLWVILLPLGGLGMDESFLPNSFREWLRLFSWMMMYLLVMQLKPLTSPQRVISWLFWALAIPLAVAVLQLLAPSVLPPILTGAAGEYAQIAAPDQSASRIRGTLGLANTFSSFLVVFILLSWWQLKQSRQSLLWSILIGLQVVLLINTKSLFSLIMMAVGIIATIAPQVSLASLIGGLVLVAAFIGLFASTDFGQERLGSLAATPLLNPDIDVSKAILLAQTDYNSFNWRIAQWTFLLQAWEQYPILGYGLLTCPQLTVFNNYAHNEYIRALTEGGIVGLLLFLLLLGVMLFSLIWRFRQSPIGSAQRDFCTTLIAILMATIVGMTTENIWTHTTLFYYWWTLMAVAGWDWNESPRDRGAVDRQQPEVYP